MIITEAVLAILAGAATLLGAESSLVWWAYKRGNAAAQDKAKIEELGRSLAETRAELAALQSRRRRP